MIRYLAYLPFFILMRMASFVLAGFAVRNYSTPDKKHIVSPFLWMMTIDNDLGGDEGWKSQHLPLGAGSDPYADENRIGWMKRNGGNWASYYTFGVPYQSEAFWSVGSRPFAGKNLEWRFGWNTLDQKMGRCKINLSIRWR